jgi:hypothetical protein
MHLGFFSVALLLGNVLASPVEKQLSAKEIANTNVKQLKTRDTQVIDRYIKKISDDLVVIKNTIRGLPSGGTQEEANDHALRLLDQYQKLNKDIRDGSRDIRRGPSVTYIETALLLTGVNSFATLITEAVNAIMTENAKRMIWTAGKQDAQKRFYTELVSASEGCTNFGDAMVSRIPGLDQGVATIFKNAFINLIEPAVTVSLQSVPNYSASR